MSKVTELLKEIMYENKEFNWKREIWVSGINKHCKGKQKEHKVAENSASQNFKAKSQFNIKLIMFEEVLSKELACK